MMFNMATTAFAATVTPEVDRTSVAAGEDVTVELKLDEAMEGVTNFQYRLYFDENLFVLKSSTNGTAHEDTEITKKAKTDKDTQRKYYGISLVDTKSEGLTVNAGTIYTLVFTALEDLTEDQAVSFEVTRDRVTGTDFKDNNDGLVENGSVSITVKPVTPAEPEPNPITKVEITNPKIVVDESTGEMTMNLVGGSSEALNLNITLENGQLEATQEISWTSSNSSVAWVEDGYLKTGIVTEPTTVTLTAIAVDKGDESAAIDEEGPEALATLKVTVNPAAKGYTFATSADQSAEYDANAVVHVKITGHSDESVTSYNAYDVTLTFDSEKLELAKDAEGNYVYSGAVKDDGGSVTVNGNEIRIVGCGEAKEFGTEIAALTFKTKAEGAANVTISKVQVSDQNEAVKEDAPEAAPEHAEGDTSADATPDISVIVVPYTVTKPEAGFISGADKILHGEDYTFSYTDTANYTYSNLVVKVGGTVVTPSESNGVYTIANVTGAVEITATQTPNSYKVTMPKNVTGDEYASYGTDYVFTIKASEGKIIDSVTVTLTEGGKEVPYVWDQENDRNIIAGKDIVGAFTITVTEIDAQKQTTIHFVGVTSNEIVGGLTQTATVGQAFTFELNEDAENYTYTAKVGGTVLTADEQGVYTIPASLVAATGVTVTIEKTEIKKLAVDVAEFFNVDGQTMFLVTAKWADKVLAWGENTMIYSAKYTVTGYEAGAYCWLVMSTGEMNSVNAVKAAAEGAIVEAADGATAAAVKYDYDINGTTKVDVNDAQVAYDMYNAHYTEFTKDLPMLKFLEADMKTDAKLDTQDVAAIISYIVSGANA